MLYRTHAQSRVLEEALRFNDMPYRVVGGMRFYDRAEVKDLLCYLRVVHNPDDDVSLLRDHQHAAARHRQDHRSSGCSTPPRARARSVWQALCDADDRSAAQRGRAQEPRAVPRADRSAARGSGGGQRAARSSPRRVLAQTGYAQALKAEDNAEADARLENLQEVLGSMVEFERDAEEPTLAAFLELVTLADRRRPRRPRRRGHADDGARGQGARVPGGDGRRPRGGDLPASRPLAGRRPGRPRGGAPPRLRGVHARAGAGCS